MKIIRRTPTEDQVTIKLDNTKPVILTIDEYSEILKKIPRECSSKDYLKYREQLIIDHIDNMNKPKSLFTW